MKWTLWTVALVVLASTPGPGWGAVPDHLACYKIKDSHAKATYTANVSGLVVQSGCTIKVPGAMACVPASKTNVTPIPRGGGGVGRPNGFTCYKVKCPKTTFTPVTVSDQFGSRSVTPSTTQLVCAPDVGPTDGGFPATGQTTCWDSSGNVIPCAGTGHDGDTHTGAPLAYVDNGDGTITDANTGLMWEKLSNGDGSVHDFNNRYTWAQAFSLHVATLNSTSFGGHADWRVPNVKELQSIVNYDNVFSAVSPAFNTNCTSPCTVTACSCVQNIAHWSSSTYTYYPQYAWFVNFVDGLVNADFKTGSFSVRAVR
jgi:type 1 fimbria pilin